MRNAKPGNHLKDSGSNFLVTFAPEKKLFIIYEGFFFFKGRGMIFSGYFLVGLSKISDNVTGGHQKSFNKNSVYSYYIQRKNL